MKPINAVRTAALAAVAEVGAQSGNQSSVVTATGVVFRGVRCTLIEARDAVLWALAHPGAASLPVGSVVASTSDVWIKSGGYRSAEPTMPWVTTACGTTYLNIANDDAITDMLRSDEATILRIGDGA
jgi:hypothetical protein